MNAAATTPAACRRLYRVRVYRQGPQHQQPEDKGVITDLRIHAVALEMFRRTLGGTPAFTWVDNGRSAEVWDDKGGRVHVVQLNKTTR